MTPIQQSGLYGVVMCCTFAAGLKKNTPYGLLQRGSSIFMILALTWLTVSLPFVYKADQTCKELSGKHTAANQPGDDSNPLTNTTEEKTPSSINLTEEYIHHSNNDEHPWFSITKHHRDFSVAVYVAYHGEPLCPPPNA